MTDEEVEFTSSRPDLGSGLTLWVSKMIQDEKQQFRVGVSFLA